MQDHTAATVGQGLISSGKLNGDEASSMATPPVTSEQAGTVTAEQAELLFLRAVTAESISRRDPTKVPIMVFSFKSLYHPVMCLGTTHDHSRAPGAPDGHSMGTLNALFLLFLDPGGP